MSDQPDADHRTRPHWLAVLGMAMLLGVTAAHGQSSGASPGAGGAAADAAKFTEMPATPDLLRRLQAGGYTLYLRHGPTNNSIPDRLPKVDLNDCSTQRPLTDAGREVMARVGAAMRQARIPIGEFKVSPLCRARDSASAAFPQRTPDVEPLLMYVANFTAQDKAPVVAHTRRLLATPVPPGSNRLVLAHAPNLMELLGYFPKEGTLVILRPKGEAAGFDYLGSVTPEAWPGLLR